MKIELTQAEHALLITFLQERQRELLHEISKADAHHFRTGLREKEALLESMLRKLAAEAVCEVAA